MKTVNLAERDWSISQLIEIAKLEPILVHAPDGSDFIFEEADEFEHEATALGTSEKFMSFLEGRSRDGKEIPALDVARRMGIEFKAK